MRVGISIGRLLVPKCTVSLSVVCLQSDETKAGASLEDGDDEDDLAELQVPLEEMFEDLNIEAQEEEEEEEDAGGEGAQGGVFLDEDDMDL